MDIVNSQNLTHSDGYYHRFVNVDDYKWGINVKQSYLIHVKQAPAGYKPTQTVIHLQVSNGVYEVVAPGTEITIYTGDHVLWHNDTLDTTVPPYAIVGDNGKSGGVKDAFNSRLLAAEDAFSHFLLQPGDYQYQVSGGGSVQQGSFSVKSPNPNPNGGYALVTLEDGKTPNPDPIKKADGSDVYTGDTILWDVHKGSNLSIKTL